MDFTGPSANYLRQQCILAVNALDPLAKLGPDVERQGLQAMLAVLGERLTRLPPATVEESSPPPPGEMEAGL
jgi:hypothetical protein